MKLNENIYNICNRKSIKYTDMEIFSYIVSRRNYYKCINITILS